MISVVSHSVDAISEAYNKNKHFAFPTWKIATRVKYGYLKNLIQTFLQTDQENGQEKHALLHSNVYI